MEIDITNVKTMGEFRVAIQEAVDEYVSEILYGIHGIKPINETATAGLSKDEIISVSVDFSKELVNKPIKHWGIFNIVSIVSSDYDKYNTHVVPQVQIIAWWNGKGFNYTISHNSLRVNVVEASMPPHELQYIKDDTVEFDDSTNTLKFNIINLRKKWRGESSITAGGSFKIDYHIW